MELLSARSRLGPVDVLCRPECILLEEIEPGHQHIDLIYFARVTGGRLVLSDEEADGCRWCGPEELGEDGIHEDIRALGRRAIDAVARLEGSDGRRAPSGGLPRDSRAGAAPYGRMAGGDRARGSEGRPGPASPFQS